MPIVSRVLDHVRPQRNGLVGVREVLTDSRGRVWYHTYRALSLAAAQAAMAARDMTSQLKDRETRDSLEAIRAGRDPAKFAVVDLTQGEHDTRLVVYFSQTGFGRDSDFLRGAATWVDSFTAGQVGGFIGDTNVAGQIVKDRAVVFRDTIDPGIKNDNGRVRMASV